MTSFMNKMYNVLKCYLSIVTGGTVDMSTVLLFFFAISSELVVFIYGELSFKMY